MGRLRVIAGRFRGRILESVPGVDVRPTADRVREALFSQLGDLEGQRVLDLYAGTGALGIEALSRGAKEVVFVDRAEGSLKVLKKNVASLELEDRAEVHRGEAGKVVARLGREGREFDLVLLDPPYASQEIVQVLPQLVAAALLASKAQVVVESDRHTPPPPVEGLTSIDERRYGDTLITRFEAERVPKQSD